MELKRIFHYRVARRGELLIEPLWNWNPTCFLLHHRRPSLLIEPLWNWNSTTSKEWALVTCAFNRTTMELKHLFSSSSLIAIMLTFNRTTMELKHNRHNHNEHSQNTFNRTTMELKRTSSIARHSVVSTFNRTTMELKPPIRARYDQKRLAFNRTTMELKRRSCPNSRWHSAAFNRTTMELKPICERDAWSCTGRLLIEPLWNWNAFRRLTALQNPWLLIEPLWNWNRDHEQSNASQPPFNRTTMELKPANASAVTVG